jgi:hypothetical protein
MIEEVQTGRSLATKVLSVTIEDLRSLGAGWNFDWLSQIRRAEVFKLVTLEDQETIQGLISIKRGQGYIEASLLEADPANVGRSQRFKGVAGNLLAFAARLSRSLGFEGYVTLHAKTSLMKHYKNEYGFESVGNSQKMILPPLAAAQLIARFLKEADDETAT